MAELYALVSAGGSPGVTTTAIALALTWPSRVIVAECDPSGGDVLAGLLTGHVPASGGLMDYAIEAGRGSEAAERSLAVHLLALDAEGTRMILPGITDPRQATSMASAWPAVAASLTAQPTAVIADCGRLDGGPGQPLALLSAARTVAVVLRPTLRQVWSARFRIDMLAQVAGSSRLALLVTGSGTHSAREVGQALSLPVTAVLADDSRSAALLSDGLGGRRDLSSGALLSSARAAGLALRRHGAVVTAVPAQAEAVR